jgi:hypothetical protein
VGSRASLQLAAIEQPVVASDGATRMPPLWYICSYCVCAPLARRVLMPNHQVIDERSLAFGQAIATKLIAQPELVDRAKATLRRWMTTCSRRAQPALREWQSVLDGPLDGVISLLTSRDDRSRRLRQSNPFAGVLSNEERNAIIRRFQSNDAATA